MRDRIEDLFVAYEKALKEYATDSIDAPSPEVDNARQALIYACAEPPRPKRVVVMYMRPYSSETRERTREARAFHISAFGDFIVRARAFADGVEAGGGHVSGIVAGDWITRSDRREW